MSEQFTAWITKYALAGGIERHVVRATEYPKLVYDGRGQGYVGEGIEWHRTEAAAIARAESMRVAKIASLRKSIAKLEKLRFGDGG